MKGQYLHFDWIIGDVDLCALDDNNRSVQFYLTIAEARTLARRLNAWSDWREARKAGRTAKQPGNIMKIARAMNHVSGPRLDDRAKADRAIAMILAPLKPGEESR